MITEELLQSMSDCNDAFGEVDAGEVAELIQGYREQQLEIQRLRDALAEIAEGRGRFSQDRLTHALTTVDDAIANGG